MHSLRLSWSFAKVFLSRLTSHVSFPLPVDLMALEALAALSVAGTVLQFVEFAGKIIKRSFEIARDVNGEAQPERGLRTVTVDFAYLASKIQRPLRLEDSFGPPTQDEQSIIDVCHGCESVAQELLGRLKGLDGHGKPRPFEAFRRAIVITWTRRERNKLTQELHIYQRALNIRILVGLRHVLS